MASIIYNYIEIMVTISLWLSIVDLIEESDDSKESIVVKFQIYRPNKSAV